MITGELETISDHLGALQKLGISRRKYIVYEDIMNQMRGIKSLRGY
jgi:hypothetical protein